MYWGKKIAPFEKVATDPLAGRKALDAEKQVKRLEDRRKKDVKRYRQDPNSFQFNEDEEADLVDMGEGKVVSKLADDIAEAEGLYEDYEDRMKFLKKKGHKEEEIEQWVQNH